MYDKDMSTEAEQRPFCRRRRYWDTPAWRMQHGRRGWLRPTVLKIFEDGPVNGIEIMNRIQQMSHGWWRPSPGSMYPLLEELSNENMISKRGDGKYELTEKYKEECGPIGSGEMDNILTNMESDVSYLEELAQSDKTKFFGHKKRIEKIARRLSELK
jgi:DNA-binding PadR family transcriptional regulator